MCNLFANLTTHEAMRQLFDLEPKDSSLPPDWVAAGPIYPKRPAAVACLAEGHLCLREMQWGFLLPQASKRTGRPISPKAVTNARDDKLLASRFWRSSMQRRRCIVPATSYCEHVGRNPSVPHWFEVIAERGTAVPFGFAGVWTEFESGDQSISAFAIATTNPNEFVSSYHHRMPVIIDRARYHEWLFGSVEDAADLLRPLFSKEMRLAPPPAARSNIGIGLLQQFQQL